MTSQSDYLKELIGAHGSIKKIVHIPLSKDHPQGHLLLEFQDEHVEIGEHFYLCREHLERVATVAGIPPRKIEWALKQSKVEEFIVWNDPHVTSE